jgi:hypothetical protein
MFLFFPPGSRPLWLALKPTSRLQEDDMPKPTLKNLGISASSVPLLKSFLDVQDKVHQIRHVQASSAAATGDLVSRRFTTAHPTRLRKGRKGAKKNGASRPPARKSASSGFHEVRRLLDERAFYPPHDARKESSAYAKVHKRLVKQHGCLICGVTNDILKNKKTSMDLTKNPYAAKQLETHHHVIEWALANAIDTDKFNKLVFPHLRSRHSDRYTKPLTAQEVKDWVDHSEDNLWVLCDVHHRAPHFGIHEITDPLWGPQDIFNDAFLKQVRAAIGSEKKKSRSPRKSNSGAKKRKTAVALRAAA